MSRRASREARLLRGLVVAGAGAGLALAGHLAAGGTAPRSPALLLLVLLSAAATTLLSEAEWSYRRLLVALGAVQLLVHLGLGVDHGSMAAAGTHGGAGAGASGWLMLAAHTGAAVVTAWLLRDGEAAYWRLLDTLGRRRLVRPLPLPVAGRAPVPVPAPPATPSSVLRLGAAVSRRGPPTLVA